MSQPRDYDKTNKMFAYMRIGIYWVTKAHAPWYNFCDVHQVFPNSWGTTPSDVHLYYTGPRDPIKAIKPPSGRSRAYDSVYVQNNPDLMRDLDLENGGEASAIWMKHAKTYDLWLFGPLSFLGATYGTLLISLEGYHPVVSFTRWRKPPLEPETEIKWPVGNTHFHPCKIYANEYGDYPLGAERPHKVAWNEVDFDGHLKEIGEMSAAKKDLTPVRLPDFARGAAWKVEAYSGAATLDEYLNQCG